MDRYVSEIDFEALRLPCLSADSGHMRLVAGYSNAHRAVVLRTANGSPLFARGDGAGKWVSYALASFSLEDIQIMQDAIKQVDELIAGSVRSVTIERASCSACAQCRECCACYALETRAVERNARQARPA